MECEYVREKEGEHEKGMRVWMHCLVQSLCLREVYGDQWCKGNDMDGQWANSPHFWRLCLPMVFLQAFHCNR